ncbi:MAG: helicase-associated domain-containing protein [Mycobacteriaceae bacterium]|nr:helicase-associated domain-containing protein [Mycobacteriaceae bacterium]
MTEQTSGMPLGSWLTKLPDQRLIRLLELRPDLAQPAPNSIVALAARAQARQSIRAATDDLDFLRLAVIDALLVLHANIGPVPVTKLVTLLGDRAVEAEVLAALDDLRERALAWGDLEVQVAEDAGMALPWHPGQVTSEEVTHTRDQLVELVAQLDEAQRAVLDKLLEGSPIGRTRDAALDAPAHRPVPQLLKMGLLQRVDTETVILPRHVAQALSEEDSVPLQLTPPDPVVASTVPTDVDATASGAVLELLHELEVLIDSLGAAPIAELRSGGLGIREVKRLAKITGIHEMRLGFILELAAAAGLIACGTPDPEPPDGDGPYWSPTMAADRFATMSTAERWHVLATTWIDLHSRPALIGSRGADAKVRGALSHALYSTAAPLDRRLLLGMLAELEPGAGVDAASASQALVWRRPRWSARLQPEPVADLLNEAQLLGLVGRGAISTPGRALLADTGTETATTAMTAALPKPINHFLLQADLTVVVPGPLERDLTADLTTIATLESAGTAMVYRVTEQSIRHALDVGLTREWMHNFFAKYSKTPVPQGLTYLIDDVARRHGQLRIGMAASFVRCEDPALLAQAVNFPAAQQLQLRALAPTVAVSPAPIADVLAALRSAGFAPAAEDSSGAVVDVRPRRARVPTPQHRRPYRLAARPTGDTLSAVVAVLRKVTSAPFTPGRIDPTAAMSLLQRAVTDEDTVVISYIDAAGVATSRVVSPISVRGGQLMAFDSSSGRLRDFAIHRITSVATADNG